MESPRKCWLCLVLLLTIYQFKTSLADHEKSSDFRFLNAPFQFQPVSFGSNFAFNCTTNGNNVNTSLYFQTPYLYPNRWNQITNDTSDVQVNGDVYTLMNIGIREAGYYKCKATNGSGYTIEWPNGYGLLLAYLLRAPEITVVPNHLVDLTEGDSQNFTCESQSTHTKLKWFRAFIDSRIDKVRPIPKSKTLFLRDTTTNVVKNIFMVKDARESDSGIFKCVSNFRGKKRTKYTALRVHKKRPPMILSHISSMDVISPQTAKLECTIEGHPTPNIIWYKDNKEVKIPGCSLNRVFSCGGKKHSMWIKRRSEKRQIYDVYLSIKKTEYPKDHGVYRCEASNDGGTAKADIFVNVQEKPALNKASSKIVYSTQVKPPYTVSCALKKQSNPPATTITWQLQPFWETAIPHPDLWVPASTTGHVIRQSKDGMTSTVEIPSFIVRAFFRCTATNAVGKDTHTIKYIRHVDYYYHP